MIRTDGYYISEGLPWVDWHAGHKFEGVSYIFLCFRTDKKFIQESKNDSGYNFLSFLNSVDDEKLLEDTSITFGEYIESNNIVKFIWEVWGEKRTKTYTILSPDILLDENLKEYRFTR